MVVKIQVLFFGATASIVGERRIKVTSTESTTSQMVVDQVKNQFPALDNHKLLYSFNQNYAKGDEIVCDGDEIAIFTAVSGG